MNDIERKRQERNKRIMKEASSNNNVTYTSGFSQLSVNTQRVIFFILGLSIGYWLHSQVRSTINNKNKVHQTKGS